MNILMRKNITLEMKSNDLIDNIKEKIQVYFQGSIYQNFYLDSCFSFGFYLCVLENEIRGHRDIFFQVVAKGGDSIRLVEVVIFEKVVAKWFQSYKLQ